MKRGMLVLAISALVEARATPHPVDCARTHQRPDTALAARSASGATQIKTVLPAGWAISIPDRMRQTIARLTEARYKPHERFFRMMSDGSRKRSWISGLDVKITAQAQYGDLSLNVRACIPGLSSRLRFSARSARSAMQQFGSMPRRWAEAICIAWRALLAGHEWAGRQMESAISQ